MADTAPAATTSEEEQPTIDMTIISGEEWFTQVFKAKMQKMLEFATKDFEVSEEAAGENSGKFFQSSDDVVDKEKLKKEFCAKQKFAIVNECHELLKVEMREVLISKTERKRIAKELIEALKKDCEQEMKNAFEIANAERAKVLKQKAEKEAKAQAEAKAKAEKAAAEAAVAAEKAAAEAEAKTEVKVELEKKATLSKQKSMAPEATEKDIKAAEVAEAEAKKAAEAEAIAKKKAEEEEAAAAKKKAEEKLAAEASAKAAAEEAAAAAKKAEELAAAKKAEEAEKERAAKAKAEEDRLAKIAEEEAAKKAAEKAEIEKLRPKRTNSLPKRLKKKPRKKQPRR
jgi:hypothetical protein